MTMKTLLRNFFLLLCLLVASLGLKAQKLVFHECGGVETVITLPADMHISAGGDVNGDGAVDVADIASIIDVMAGSAPSLATAADVNGDSSVDVADIATIIDIMAGGDEDPGTGKAPAGAVAVDLGLPSGTKWANMNIGAEKPEDYGLYFAWGETTGYTSDTSDGRLFDSASYKWMTAGQASWQWVSKYQVVDGMTEGCWYDGSNFVGDGKTTLELADDAARANWGGQWVMPTYEDMCELVNNTTSVWTTLNGVKGRTFTSKTNGNSIFLPAAGSRHGGSLSFKSLYGYYWSSTVNPSVSSYARCLNFASGEVVTDGHYGIPRFYGHSVRPVLRN